MQCFDIVSKRRQVVLVTSATTSETGMKPMWSPESFTDLDAEVRNSLNRIRNTAFIPHKNARGFVYDVDTGRLREVR